MRKKLFLVLFIVGFVIFLTPFIRKEYTNYIFKIKSENIHRNMGESSKLTKKKKLEKVENGSSERSGLLEQKKFSYKISNDAIGYLNIPKINQTLPLFLGATDSHLANGVAQIRGTGLPLDGMSSNSVIAGHRGYYGASIFRDIDQLEQGDLIYVNYFGEMAVYRVREHFIITPDDIELLEPIEGREILTLFTCHPYPRNSHRLLVQTERLKVNIDEIQEIISVIE